MDVSASIPIRTRKRQTTANTADLLDSETHLFSCQRWQNERSLMEVEAGNIIRVNNVIEYMMCGKKHPAGRER